MISFVISLKRKLWRTVSLSNYQNKVWGDFLSLQIWAFSLVGLWSDMWPNHKYLLKSFRPFSWSIFITVPWGYICKECVLSLLGWISSLYYSNVMYLCYWCNYMIQLTGCKNLFWSWIYWFILKILSIFTSYFVFVWDSISLYHRTHYVSQASFELKAIPLPQHAETWDC